MFEKASRMKLRFNFKGQCSVEDLWELPLENLDIMYRSLRKKQRDLEGEESLLTQKTIEDETLELQIGIIKRIVEVKKAEKEARVLELENRQQARKLDELIAEKKQESLRGKSLEELIKMRDAL